MINDPVAISFANEHVRPMAERLRAIKAMIDDSLQRWTLISSKFPNLDTEIVDDGRDAEGVTRMNGADVNNFMAVLQALQTRFNQPGVAAVLDKPCVRPLQLTI